ncbi:thermonuclease family protein [Paenibacillus sediminis]|uniref:Micrococcal nuclease n=1 Tax=Paenibacillus sediminis TaxID=664909 RepID=A0ABS4H4G8_9BACL|nr:thermonuclease family protein [Paenibacillus sediminis]MBP1937429.1 micrococcal nuclease [Paenibacillus sediminis]
MKFIRLLSVFFLTIFLVTGCSTSAKEDLHIKRVPVKLDHAIDGDTISVIYNGKPRTVRFLLIDTPETSHPKLGEQPFGQEAKSFTKKMVEGANTLELEFDIGPNHDKYSRLLAYVYVDGKMLQESLLEKGLARVAYIYPPNVRYVDRFEAIQKESQKKRIGIWQIENYAQDNGFHPEVMRTKRSTIHNMISSQTTGGDNKGAHTTPVKPSNGCKIKGNINAKGDKIYHTPSSPSYDNTKPEVWFCSEKEALSAGFHAPR